MRINFPVIKLNKRKKGKTLQWGTQNVPWLLFSYGLIRKQTMNLPLLSIS